MNSVTAAIRAKYPQYQDTLEEDLVRAIAEKYPAYLQQEDFRKDYESFTRSASSGDPEDSPPEEDAAPAVEPEATPQRRPTMMEEARQVGTNPSLSGIVNLGMRAAMTPPLATALAPFSTDASQAAEEFASKPVKPLEYVRKLGQGVMTDAASYAAEKIAGPEAGQIMRGALEGYDEITSYFRSPQGIALATTGGELAPIAHKLMTTGFTAQMALNAPEQYNALKKAIASGDPKEIAKRTTELIATGVFVASGAKHLLTRTPKPAVTSTPESDRAMAETAPETPPEQPSGGVSETSTVLPSGDTLPTAPEGAAPPVRGLPAPAEPIEQVSIDTTGNLEQQKLDARAQAEAERQQAKAQREQERGRPDTTTPTPPKPNPPVIPLVALPPHGTQQNVSDLEQARIDSEHLGNLILQHNEIPVSLVEAVKGKGVPPEDVGWHRVGDVYRYEGVMTGQMPRESTTKGQPDAVSKQSTDALPVGRTPGSGEGVGQEIRSAQEPPRAQGTDAAPEGVAARSQTEAPSVEQLPPVEEGEVPAEQPQSPVPETGIGKTPVAAGVEPAISTPKTESKQSQPNSNPDAGVYRMTKAEALEHYRKVFPDADESWMEDRHQYRVEEALRQGVIVPDNVLKEFGWTRDQFTKIQTTKEETTPEMDAGDTAGVKNSEAPKELVANKAKDFNFSGNHEVETGGGKKRIYFNPRDMTWRLRDDGKVLGKTKAEALTALQKDYGLPGETVEVKAPPAPQEKPADKTNAEQLKFVRSKNFATDGIYTVETGEGPKRVYRDSENGYWYYDEPRPDGSPFLAGFTKKEVAEDIARRYGLPEQEESNAEQETPQAAEAAKVTEPAAKPFTVENLQSEMGLSKEEAEATMAIADAMGLDKSRMELTKGGTPAKEALYSIRSWGETDKEAVRTGLRDIGMSEKEANRAIADVEEIAKVISDNAEVLDYEANRTVSSFKDNADPYYGESLDFSTICRKAAKLVATVTEVQKRVGRAISPAEWLEVRKRLAAKHDVVSCFVCYVFSKKIHIGNSINQLRRFYPDVPAEIWADPLRHPELVNYPTPDWAYAEMAKESKYPEEELRNRITNAGKYLSSKGQAVGKAFEPRTDYRGEFLRLRPDAVERINRVSGQRAQSWSDFEPIHLIDKMQSVLDAAAKKLAMHSYTKEANYVDLAAPTGEMVNMSLIPKDTGLDAKGNLLFDPVEGMPIETALAKRKQHRTAGTILIGANDAHIIAAMADPRIDYIIPYHKSGLSEQLAGKGLKGWVDYESRKRPEAYQKEVVVDQAKFDKYMAWKEQQGMLKTQHEIRPWEYWDKRASGDKNAARYLKWADKNGIRPKFEMFSKLPGYWKLLVDRRMFDADGKYIEQQPVRPTWNKRLINNILSGVLEGDIPATGDYTPNEKVVEDMVGAIRNSNKTDHELVTEPPLASQKFTARKAPKVLNQNAESRITPEQDATYMDAVKRGDTETAQKMVDEAARKARYNIDSWKGWFDKDADTGKPITVMGRKVEFPAFNRGEAGVKLAGFFAADKGVADKFASGISRSGVVDRFYLRFDKPFVMNGSGKFAGNVQFGESGKEFRDAIRSGKYDGIVIKDTKDEGTIFVALDSTNVKRADAVTRDNQGNVIPLSERFDPTEEDIRYQKSLAGSPKAAVEFTEGGKALIRAMESPDVSSGVHELAHTARRFLLDRAVKPEDRLGITDEHIAVAEEWAGAKDGVWDVKAEEKFARGFERYLRDGEAPSTMLKEVFAKFRQWLSKIYTKLAGSPLSLKITPEMRKVYDALVTRGEKQGIRKSVERGPEAVSDTSKGPGKVGLGAAMEDEFGETKDYVSNMFAAIAEDRAKMGKEPMPPGNPRTWSEDDALATAKMNREPDYFPNLVESLRKKPRPIASWEHSGILWLKAKYTAELNNANARIAQAFDDKRTEDMELAQIDSRHFEDELQKIDEAVGPGGSGSEHGRSLQSQKKGIDPEDMSIVQMRLARRAAKGGAPLTRGEELEIEDLKKKIDQGKKEYEDMVAKKEAELRQKDLDRTMAEERARIAEERAKNTPRISKQVLDYAEKIVSGWESKVPEHAENLRKKLASLSAGVDPTIISDAAYIAFTKLARAALNKAQLIEAMVAEFGEKFRQIGDEVWDKANALMNEKLGKVPKSIKNVIVDNIKNPAPKAPKAPKAPRVRTEAGELDLDATIQKIADKFETGKMWTITPQVRKLVRMFIEDNPAITRDQLLDQVHEFLKDFDDTITRHDANDAITGKGKFWTADQDEVSKKIRDFSTQLRYISHQEDVVARKPLARTGFQRDPLSDAARKELQILNELKRKHGVVETDPGKQLASVLTARKTYYIHRMSDLKAEIAARKLTIKTKSPSPMDAELKALMDEYEAVKAEHAAMFPKNRIITTEQRIKMALASAERMEREWKVRLDDAKKGIYSRPKGAPRPTNAQIEAIKARAEAFKAEIEHLKDLDAAYQEMAEAERLQDSIDEYTRKLRDSEFEVDEKGEKVVTPLLKDLREKRDAARRAFETARKRSPEALAIALKRAEEYGAELERRINEGDIAPRTKKSTAPTSPELVSQRLENADMMKILQTMRNAAKPKMSPAERALKAYKSRLANMKADYEKRLADKDFAPRVKVKPTLDEATLRAKAKAEWAKKQWQVAQKREQRKHRTGLEKTLDTIIKYRRGFVLSGPSTFAKLTGAAVARVAFSPIEEVIGGVIGHLPVISKIAERAPSEGRMSIRVEKNAFKSMFGEGARDAWQTARTGRSDLDVTFGKKDSYIGEIDPEEKAWINVFGHIHGALKSPTKRNAFTRSYLKRKAFYANQGIDVEDPHMQIRIGGEAYQDALRSIFLQDNKAAGVINAVERYLEQKKKDGKVSVAGRISAAVIRFMLPITKVPVNVVGETIQYSGGGLTRGTLGVLKALRKGADSLTPEEADLVMRDLKKGVMGGLLLLGFFAPQMFGGYYQAGEKRKRGDVKEGQIRTPVLKTPDFMPDIGGDIAYQWLHSPVFETIQVGATMRRVADSMHKGQKQGLTSGMLAGAMGLVDQVAFVREMAKLEALRNPYQRGKYFEDVALSAISPQAVSQIAKYTDVKDGDVWFWDKPIPRKPTSFWQRLEVNFPYAREQVPKDYKKMYE